MTDYYFDKPGKIVSVILFHVTKLNHVIFFDNTEWLAVVKFLHFVCSKGDWTSLTDVTKHVHAGQLHRRCTAYCSV